MCGISGLIAKTPKADKSFINQQLIKMTDLVKHRGPNGEGLYFDKNLGLGHRRLSIIDLSADGQQPMNWNEVYTITFNGEIYNYIEIRDFLKNAGYNFTTQSDTEVILAAYDFWGEKCVLEFNGMWAFAIHDKKKNTLFCSRDRFGVKPFYYYSDEELFAFGSEVKQLLPFLKKRQANIKQVINYIVLNISDYNEETFFKDIFKLPGGHNLIYNFDKNQFDIYQYYQINKRSDIARQNETESIEEFSKIFKNAIQYRLRSDVKVGTCLSGGLDSSSIAAIASNLYRFNSNERFSAITAGCSDPVFDETDFAKIVANAFDLEMFEIRPEKKDFLENLDKVIYTQEYPFIGPTVYMQYFVMKKAKEVGVTVLLDGQGADEALLGYVRYTPQIIFSKGLKYIFVNLLSLPTKYNISFFDFIKNLLYFTSSRIRLYRQLKIYSGLKKEFIPYINKELVKKYASSYKDVFELQKLEFTKTQIPQLLRFEDKNSMAHSIETRLPFMDWELVENALSLNSNYKINAGWSKYVLRKSVENILPKEIVWRRNKFGFNAPINDWIDDSFVNVMEIKIKKSKLISIIFSEIPNNINKSSLWRLYNLARWEEMFEISF